MKRFFLLPIFFICLFYSQITALASDQDNVFDKQLTFNNEVYFLTYSRTSEKYTINEYTRKNETVHKWNKLIAVRFWVNPNINLKKFIKDTYSKQKDNYIPLSISCNENVALISFIMLAPNYIEYNCWKYCYADKYLTAIQYARKFKITKKTTAENLMKRIQTHHNQISPIINKDLPIGVTLKNIGDD
ncbi:hypothetical protein IKJ53_06110 [bacterium]|nr:hypothetical protein [bacterium]